MLDIQAFYAFFSLRQPICSPNSDLAARLQILYSGGDLYLILTYTSVARRSSRNPFREVRTPLVEWTSRTEYATQRAAYSTNGGLRSSSECARAHAMHDAHCHFTDSLIFAQNRFFLFEKLIKRFFQLLLKCLIALK